MSTRKLLSLTFALSICTSVSGQVYQQGYPAQQYQNPIVQQPHVAQPYAGQTLQGTVVAPTNGQSVLASPQTGQQLGNTHWTQQFTEETSHEFGAVAKASKQEHVFEFVNNLDTDIHLVGVRASCGCTIPTILTPVVKPGEVAQLKAKFDTLKFDGARGATLDVTIRKDQPYVEFGNLQFSVKGQIRRDVVLSPPSVEFTELLKGKEAQRTLTLQYAGSPEWMVKEVMSSNPNFTVEFNETLRDAASRRVSYELVVRANGEQKEGQFMGNLTVVTNDRANEQISIEVTGRILSVIETSDIQLGVIDQEKKVEKSMIIRGVRPFSIEDIRVNNSAIKILGHEGEKTLHIVKYELDTSKQQVIEDTIEIVTSDPLQKTATLNFSAQIVESTVAVGSAAK